MATHRPAFIRKSTLFIATACLFVGISTHASATLIGQSVFGVLNFGGSGTNLFAPANIGLTQGALNELSNPVTISNSASEFSHVDNGVIGVFVNFEEDSMKISTDVATAPAAPWTISFTSAGFIGLILTETSDNFVDGGVNAMLAGDTLTFNWAGTSSPAFYTAEYDLVAATAVPEPGAWAVLLIGLAGLGYAARRRGPQIA